MSIDTLYRVNYFADFSDLTATPGNVRRMMDILRDFDYLPSTFQEFNPTNPMPTTRMRFSAHLDEWVVNIGSQFISIDKQPLDPTSSNMGDIKEFCRRASQTINLFIDEFNRKGKRISLISMTMFNDMSRGELYGSYTKLVNPIELHKESSPVEWNVRTVSRVEYDIANKSELLNVITNVARLQGKIQHQGVIEEFDRLNLELDINTVGQNEAVRIDKNFVVEFFSKAIETRALALSQVESALYE